MEIDEHLIEYIANTFYDLNPIVGSIRELYGYSDKNYAFTDSNDHNRYVLKLVNPDESQAELVALIDEAFEAVENCLNEGLSKCIVLTPKLVRTSFFKPSGFASICVDVAQESRLVECNFKLWHFYDSSTVFDFISQHGRRLENRKRFYSRLGRACNEVARALAGLNHLREPLRLARVASNFDWDLMSSAAKVRAKVQQLFAVNHSRRALVERTLDSFVKIRPELESLPQFVIHSDMGTRNIMLERASVADYARGARRVDDERRDICVIDFQDLQVGPQVLDVAICLLYLVLEQNCLPLDEALLLIPRSFLRGFQSTGVHQLNLQQLNYAPALMRLRLCQSMLNGLLAARAQPDNPHLLQTNERGWQLLELLSSEQISGAYEEPKSGRKFGAKLAWLWTAPE